MSTSFPLQPGKQTSILVIAIVFSSLALISIGLRVWARQKLGRSLDASDYLMVASTMMMLAVCITIISAIFTGGLGYHVIDIVERFGVVSGAKTFLQHLLVVRVCNTLSLALSKMSILALCSKVFTVKWFRTAALLTMALIGLWAVGNLLVIFLICQPMAFNWDRTLEGKCGPATMLWIVAGTINIATDVIVLTLPMPYLWRLDMLLWKRVTLMITFGLGFFVIIISSIKVARLPYIDTTDVTFSAQHAMILTILEASLSIILANVPVLRPLFKSTLTTMRSATGRNKYGSATLTTAALRGSKARGFSALYDNDPMVTSQSHHHHHHNHVRHSRQEAGGFSIQAVTMVPGGAYRKRGTEDLEMGGIVVKTEFTARVDRVDPEFERVKDSLDYHARISS